MLSYFTSGLTYYTPRRTDFVSLALTGDQFGYGTTKTRA
jgi:hypothetical protein